MKASFLIGDSVRNGENQILSATIRYNKNGLFDQANERVISLAKKYAEEIGASNIRMVTVYYQPIMIGIGIIGWRETRRTAKKFNF